MMGNALFLGAEAEDTAVSSAASAAAAPTPSASASSGHKPAQRQASQPKQETQQRPEQQPRSRRAQLRGEYQKRFQQKRQAFSSIDLAGGSVGGSVIGALTEDALRELGMEAEHSAKEQTGPSYQEAEEMHLKRIAHLSGEVAALKAVVSSVKETMEEAKAKHAQQLFDTEVELAEARWRSCNKSTTSFRSSRTSSCARARSLRP